VVTVAVENLVFHKPVFVGDCLLVYATTTRVGRTSVTVDLDVQVERKEGRDVERVTEGRFIFVAIDGAWKPVPLAIPEPDGAQ
jgi:acyl-CoA thioesterase YciA